MEIPLTFRCNNNCISCIIDSRLGSEKGNLPWSEIKQRIDRLPGSCDTVGITGGEPTISQNLFRSLSYIRDMRPDMLIFLVTNARMFSYPGFARRLSDLKIRNLRLGVAIYSHRPVLHDSITMSKGSWEQTISGIRNLLNLGIRVELRIIVSRLNYSSLEATAKFIARNLRSVERVVFINMKYTGNAFRNRKSIFVRYSEIVPNATKAADVIRSAGIEVRLFHFPLCTLPEGFREMAKGVTKQAGELTFVNACESCMLREDCPRIWKSYAVLAGDDEFKPIP